MPRALEPARLGSPCEFRSMWHSPRRIALPQLLRRFARRKGAWFERNHAVMPVFVTGVYSTSRCRRKGRLGRKKYSPPRIVTARPSVSGHETLSGLPQTGGNSIREPPAA